MTDRFADFSAGLESPASHGFAITPNDGLDFAETTRALYIGGPGAVAVIMGSGAELIFQGLPAGAILPVRARRLKATGTTATAIVGLL